LDYIDEIVVPHIRLENEAWIRDIAMRKYHRPFLWIYDMNGKIMKYKRFDESNIFNKEFWIIDPSCLFYHPKHDKYYLITSETPHAWVLVQQPYIIGIYQITNFPK